MALIKPPTVDTTQDPAFSTKQILGKSPNTTGIVGQLIDTTYVDKKTEIINEPGGNVGMIQYNIGGSFGGDRNFTYNVNSRTMYLSGNIILGGYINGRITTNLFNLKVSGGLSGQILATDGNGNLSWQDQAQLQYSNSNVASYLPTYTGNLRGNNLYLSSGAYLNNVLATNITTNTLTINSEGNVNLDVTQLKMTGGSSGQVLITDGSGNLVWSSPNTLESYLTLGNSSITLAQGGTHDVWTGPFDVTPNIVGGFVNTDGSNNALMTFSTNGASSMSIALDGSLFVGDNIANYDFGHDYNTGGWVVSQNGLIMTDQAASIIFPDTTVQETAYLGYEAIISETNPGNLVDGKIWFDSNEGRAFVMYNQQWVDMNPQIAPNPDMYANSITFSDGTVLTTADIQGSSYSNSNVASYLPAYHGNVSANIATANKVGTNNVYSLNGLSVENSDLSHGPTAALIIPTNGSSQPVQINNIEGPVTIGSTNTGNLQIWSFGPDGNLSAPGNITVAANVTSNYFIGNGSQLTDILTPNLTNTTQTFVLNNDGSFGVKDSGTATNFNLDQSTPNIDLRTTNGTGFFTTGANITFRTGGSKNWIFDNGGNLSTQGNIAYVGSGSANIDGFTNANFVGNLAANTLSVTGNSQLTGSLDVTGNLSTGNNLDVDGEGHIGGNLTITGNISFSGGGSISQVNSPYGYFTGNSDGSNAIYAGYPGGTIVPNAVAQFTGDSNAYMQINSQNRNHGTQASIEYVITGDQGTDTTDYLDIGFASSTWDGTQDNSLSTAVAARDGYMYVQGGGGGGNLVLGTTTPARIIKFVTGGNGSANIRASVQDDGIHSGAIFTDNYYLANGDPLPLVSGSSNVTTTGNVSAGNVIAGNFSGNGSQLTHISGANVVGAVANANYAVYSGTAYSVSGSNVSGTVALASHATVADSANSVSGSNVSGAVAFATVANSVAAANVSGLGNVSLINKDGNASNVLYGNGVFAAPAPSSSYSNSNVTTLLSSFGSNTLVTTGNVTAGYFIGNGSQLTGLPAGYANSNVATYLPTYTGTLPNVGSITANGTITSNNTITGANIIANGNVTVNTLLLYGSNATLSTTNGSSVQFASRVNFNNTGTSFVASGNATVNGNLSVGSSASVSGNLVLTNSGYITTTSGTNGNVNIDPDGTGNVNVTGNVIISGSVTGGGIRQTTATSAPSSPTVGDQWYNSSTDVLYQYVNDGVSSYWLDIAGPGYSNPQTITKVSNFVNAGTFVTLDNIKATVTTSGNRGLSLSGVSSSFTATIGATYAVSGGTGGSSTNGTTSITTTPSTAAFGWNFTGNGDISTYIVTDTTNNRAYRITLQIGGGYNNNMITIERLI